ncbi:MAG: hypothetical protein AAFX94_08005 [Myxococcota bacterium]
MWLTLHRHHSDRARSLAEQARDVDASRLFNPSVLTHAGVTWLAIRGRATGDRIESFLLRDDLDGADRTINLSRVAKEYGIRSVADPKLLSLRDGVYVTFNTGWVRDAFNDVFLWRIAPTLDTPKRCVYPNRNRIEKNWAFFEREGELLALYALPDVMVLRGRLDGSEYHFVPYARRLDTSLRRRGLSIGTQLVPVGNEFHFVVHRKIWLNGKRLYYGVMARLNIDGPPRLRLGRRALFHSYRSLLGSANRANPNLWSCSYFSGLAKTEDAWLLGYGINDTDFAFAEASERALWG